ncbi:outer membrane protein assembly factor [Croceivirga thetidis]|uniref:Outer membrane protein assembly factor n=1 Tax=Croceivirga thetidis TaxID=2721623 RepID=A0ABX1GP05_9FLAO|nr:outer membrane protein assembly factor [Croceivirga thetidis]NKI31666.1 outer membrane protein assembly factor [Croceivirga thetidis]
MHKAWFFIFFVVVEFSWSQSIVSEIRVQGNKRTNTGFVEDFVSLREGDVLDSIVIAKDVARLIRLPSVSHAYFEVNEGQIEDEFVVVYGIEENFTLIPFANVYTSNNDEFAFRIGLQEFNFLGRNITLGAFYQYDVFHSVGLSARVPYLFSNKLGVAFNYQDLTTQEPVFLESGEADYRYNNESYEFLLLYEPNFKHRFETGLNFFTEDYQYLEGATDVNVPQELVVSKLLYKLLYKYDGLTYYYYFLDGFRSDLNLQYVRSSSNALPDFWIGFNDFSYFKRVGNKGNWATRLRLGLASNIDTPFAPFAVDNNLNIRGVGNTIDRGTAAIVLNSEFRYSLIEKDWFVLQSNIFVDGGSWRNPGGDLGDFGDSQNLRVYPGFGLRFIHKQIFNAVFRIDYGIGVTDNSTSGIVFGIGQYF